jgi:hypothetical protein
MRVSNDAGCNVLVDVRDLSEDFLGVEDLSRKALKDAIVE